MGSIINRSTGVSRRRSGAATRNRNRSENFFRDLFASASTTAATETIIRRNMTRR